MAVEPEANSPSRSAHHAVKSTLAITCAVALASGSNFPKRVVVFIMHGAHVAGLMAGTQGVEAGD